MEQDEISGRAQGGDRVQDNSVGDECLPTTSRATMNALPGLAEVPVKLRVVLGGSKISFQDAAALTQKSLLPIDRLADDPVDVLVNGKLIARGKLVVVEDTYGVQITELVGQ